MTSMTDPVIQGTDRDDQSLCENSSLKRGAGYEPAAAHRAALVFNTEKPAGCVQSPP
jgi:hypothetical protein